MRENMGLYRGKRKDNGEWIEGSLLKVTISSETCYLIFGEDFLTDGNEVVALIHALVDPETIGQFTGLPDKNGKRIFEGDVLRYCGVQNVVVSFEYGQFVINHYAINLLRSRNAESEIIGNIHDKPELLEVSEDE